MINCQICNEEFKTKRNLQYHVRYKHTMSIEEYYLKFLNDSDISCPFCDKKRKFIGFTKGYQSTCSSKSCALKQREKVWKERYGQSHPFRTKKIKEKYQQTLINRYGVDNCNKISSSKDKSIQTCLNKYGVEYSSQSSKIKEKIKETCLTKYGVENYKQSFKSRETHFKKFLPYIHKLAISKGYTILNEYENHLADLILKHESCGHEFTTSWWKFQQGGTCPKCYPRLRNTSKQEIEIRDFIKSLGFEVIPTDRKLIKPLELDIVIPDKKLAIEYCGLWYHSSGGLGIKYVKDKNYHLNKLNLCNEIGYKLITIFEDEWVTNEKIIKTKIKHTLGKSDNITKIRATKCIIKLISSKEKNKFLTEHHIQGKDNAMIKLGAFFNDQLVSVMTFNKGSISKGVKSQRSLVWELNRFASHSNFQVYGIASKFLKYFQANYKWKEIYSYADKRWSDGNLYKQLNFKLVSHTPPNYWYWGKELIARQHRFIFRKSRLKSFEHYQENLTEQQIMTLEGYNYVYDCGNLKFCLI